ncbi:MAG: 1,4-dihydroxy-2-naphthoate polyprenyltransferase [Candidatus Neomarinimicrobiota bacterium]|nr:1,4-dihydroxy-2-naphthoate polyprenyltransferase [Candidatus Neomarinimicrobiota bacterium]|tara:strand:+ start:1786 stop:2652 length:867 start_codon:yes stop_codon:yes gene_type:complete
MKNWILAARIKTLPAAISPVLIGSALAINNGSFNEGIFLMTVLAAIFIQIGANFANDVFDFQKGSDRDDRLGPLRVTQAGLIAPEKMKQGMWFVFLLSICIGFYLFLVGGWPIILIGLASILAGILYTGGPYPLGYHGWGDIFVFIFFGLIAVPGTYYLQTGVVSVISLWLGVAMGMLSNGMLVVNNIRDFNEDKISEKKTLTVRFGIFFSKVHYSLLILLPYYLPFHIWLQGENDLAVLMTYFSLPIACGLSVQIFMLTGSDLNLLLNKTARLLFIYTILFSMGLII